MAMKSRYQKIWSALKIDITGQPGRSHHSLLLLCCGFKDYVYLFCGILFDMRLTFLGTAAAEGYPATFCACENCRAARGAGGRNLRARSSVIVDGVVLIDLPPDLLARSVTCGVNLNGVRILLITHSHPDHFYYEELRLRRWPFVVGGVGALRVYGNDYVIGVLRRRFRGKLRALRMRLRALKPFERVEVGGYVIEAVRAVHQTVEGEQPLNYIISRGNKSVLYASDTGPYPEEVLESLAAHRFDAVVLESTMCGLPQERFRFHTGFESAVKLKRWMEDNGVLKKGGLFILTHFSHVSCPLHEEIEEAMKPYGIVPAYDCMNVEF